MIDCGGVPGRNFSPERKDENANVFEATVEHIRSLQGEGKKIVVAGWSDGSRERLGSVLAEHGLKKLETVSSLSQALSLRDGRVALAVIGLEAGFVAGDLAVIGEQDILGDRLAPQRRRKDAAPIFSPKSRRCRRAISSSMSITASGVSSASSRSRRRARRMTVWSCIISPATSCSCRWKTSSY